MRLIFIIAIGFSSICFSQQVDTIYVGSTLPAFEVHTDDSLYQRNLARARFYISRIYAYSEIAVGMLNGYQDSLKSLNSDKDQRKFLAKANKELKAEFGEEIKEMSITRGYYLMKLIHRETGLTVYDIVKEYRGTGKAVFWQSLCKICGQDLKQVYDPEMEDYIVEQVLQEIKTGKLEVVPRPPKTEEGKLAQKNQRKNSKKLKK